MLDLVAFRRDLHAHPETGFDLDRTPNLIAAELERAGLEVTRGVGRTGVVATLRRGPDETAIGFRADMDALPIHEMTNLPYRSKTEGKFHGCGHDGHSTMLLGAALALAADTSLDRTVHFVFQPDEENGNGAAAMIADGLFERFPMTAVFGLHNMPGMELGHFATQAGPFCAFEDNFEIRLKGQGGHASMPEKGVDPIVTGSAIVLHLQSIVSRSLPPGEHGVVSVTEFLTDGARNILPSNVTLRGDCRGFSKDVSDNIQRRMRAIVDGVCAAQEVAAEVDYSTSFQPLVNDTRATEVILGAARDVGSVDAEYGRVGFSEDFAEFLAHRPGAFILMGNGLDGNNAMPLHNPSYDFNDDAIRHGIAFWTNLAQRGF
ncbi:MULTISPECIES: amidohydrolase [unclassified Ruegeria]|uniref:amidohydrolase n=1 Tax=unclassified Ruegeria TaxID=2625375 RepID=UPI00149286AA|nr:MULTISPECIES: amidohydrolase [unclassified Ruegeria]NOD49723.1 amidohydrolase [Ruegeria sp. HKCCD5849]NOD53923.1 amidohydrolase [Ruegeria sp. HKCCD5851]NOD68868.1 amidohydrolase [Ruegeria sp. HKCCD7303]